MRESYGRPLRDPEAHIPAEIDARRLANVSPPELQSALVWSEHCTECAMPACYTSCELYTPRHDLHCRRFATDIATASAEGPGALWMTVRFRRWARLQAEGIPSLFRPRRAAHIEGLDRALGGLLRGTPLPHGFRMRLVNWWTRAKGRAFHRARVLEVITELDRRGILNSIASKNHPEHVEAVLRRLGIWELFVFPQIGWGPKSEAVRRIQRALNIGIDTFVFVDDQAFERAEVEAALPEVTVLDDQAGAELDASELCDVPRTSESARRRQFYQEQILRDDAAGSSEGEYADFLRSCRLVMEIETLREPLLDRVHELVQRTNQMNFSGRRYSKARLAELAADHERTCLVIRCADRFGDYGIIGFGILHDAEACLEDLMFSCRIQSKRVEHHFIAHLAARVARAGADTLHARYRATERNAPSGKVFDALGFELSRTEDDLRELTLDLADFELGERLIEVREAAGAEADGA